jgi:hypothetical protein
VPARGRQAPPETPPFSLTAAACRRYSDHLRNAATQAAQVRRFPRRRQTLNGPSTPGVIRGGVPFPVVAVGRENDMQMVP